MENNGCGIICNIWIRRILKPLLGCVLSTIATLVVWVLVGNGATPPLFFPAHWIPEFFGLFFGGMLVVAMLDSVEGRNTRVKFSILFCVFLSILIIIFCVGTGGAYCVSSVGFFGVFGFILSLVAGTVAGMLVEESFFSRRKKPAPTSGS